MRLNENQRGNALFLTMIMLSGILIVVLGVSNIIIPGIIMNRGKEQSVKAYFAAEAGLEQSLYYVTNATNSIAYLNPAIDDPNYTIVYGTPLKSTSTWIGTTTLSNGSKYVVAWASSTLAGITDHYFISTGYFMDAKRKVQAMIEL
jgi:hypothetical protein